MNSYIRAILKGLSSKLRAGQNQCFVEFVHCQEFCLNNACLLSSFTLSFPATISGIRLATWTVRLWRVVRRPCYGAGRRGPGCPDSLSSLAWVCLVETNASIQPSCPDTCHISCILVFLYMSLSTSCVLCSSFNADSSTPLLCDFHYEGFCCPRIFFEYVV